MGKTRLYYSLATLLVTASLDLCKAATGDYDRRYGTEIGDLSTKTKGVAGKIYAVDENRLFIKGFTYQPTGEDEAFFITGRSGIPKEQDGIIIPYPSKNSDGTSPKLQAATNKNIVLKLPINIKVSDLKWFSVWDKKSSTSLGDLVDINQSSFEIPKSEVIGKFSTLAHGWMSGMVTIYDTKTLLIPNLSYDGQGPAAWFVIANGTGPNKDSRKIPDEMGRNDVLRRYNNEDITLRLPEDVFDFKFIAAYCFLARQNFGQLDIPSRIKNMKIPPAVGDEKGGNCRDLVKDSDGKVLIQVRWALDVDGNATFRLSGRVQNNEWVGLGFSKKSGFTSMVPADAVFTYFDFDKKEFKADDAFLNERSQCDGSRGACQDEKIGGTNDVHSVHGKHENGIMTVTFKRPITTNDSAFDYELMEGLNIFGAHGLIQGSTVLKHARTTANNDIIKFTLSESQEKDCDVDLGNQAVDRCKIYEPFKRQRVPVGTTEFRATIGPSGGMKGYQAIAKQGSSGIVWWINGLLVPEIVLEKGKTYNFVINGGMNATDGAKYHPFYITSSHIGGAREEDSLENLGNATVYAGDKSSWVGPYCEFKSKTGEDPWESSTTFEDYQKNFEEKCDGTDQSKFTWTVPTDLKEDVYYQCFTHKNLGWKIIIVEPGQNPPPVEIVKPLQDMTDCVSASSLVKIMPIMLLVTSALFLLF